jgi:hypothetical protein
MFYGDGCLERRTVPFLSGRICAISDIQPLVKLIKGSILSSGQ